MGEGYSVRNTVTQQVGEVVGMVYNGTTIIVVVVIQDGTGTHGSWALANCVFLGQ